MGRPVATVRLGLKGHGRKEIKYIAGLFFLWKVKRNQGDGVRFFLALALTEVTKTIFLFLSTGSNGHTRPGSPLGSISRHPYP